MSIFLKTKELPEGCFSHIKHIGSFFGANFCVKLCKAHLSENVLTFSGCFSDIQRIHRRPGPIQQVLMSFLYFYNDAAFDRWLFVFRFSLSVLYFYGAAFDRWLFIFRFLWWKADSTYWWIMDLLSGDVVASQPIVGLDQAFGRRRRSSEENKK